MQDQELRGAGLKVTAPRIKILKILEEANPHHLSAEAIFKLLMEEGEELGLATVYRVLTQFEAADLVHRHNFEGGHSVFELNTGEHHDHLVCVTCGVVVEFLDDLVEKQQAVIAKAHGFEIQDHSHTIYGVCQKCQGS
jgi:Fur family transcriptional regulator, ferric uptake regulator